jgi:hypothetical protein
VRTAQATSDYYIDGYSSRDGVPALDSCALNTHRLGDFTARAADPFNDHEPVDSSAAAITAQGFLRLGRCCRTTAKRPPVRVTCRPG